jgi:hypothetical protein
MSMQMERSNRGGLLAACGMAVAVVIAGCGKGVGATASGTITYKGKPVPAGVIVRFQPKVPGSSSSLGVTDDQGRYELRFNANVPGVMPGESAVSFAVRESYGADGAPFIPEPLKAVRIPESASGQSSTLVKTVKPGANTIDIEIPAGAN